MKAKKIVYSALIAAMYVALTLVSSAFGLANGAIQVRLSESLNILPYFTPCGIWGVTIGCLISNIITGCHFLDVIFGTLATLIGVLFTYGVSKLNFKNKKWLAPVGGIVSNTIIIPLVLTNVYGLKDAMWFLCLTVGLGEIISCGILGMLLLFAIEKHNKTLFK